MKHREPYQDNYGEVNKVNSRKPMIPLKYDQSYKGVPDELVLDIKKAKLYAVNDNYKLIPIVGNADGVKIIRRTQSITANTNSVNIGLVIAKGDTLEVKQNGITINEGINYNIENGQIVKIKGVWNGDLEEIIFTFTLFKKQSSSGGGETVDPGDDDDVILPQNGENGQILIKTVSGMAWADVDITDEQYRSIVQNTIGADYLVGESTNNHATRSVRVPSSFPQNGITGQALVRTTDGIVWADVDITEEQYDDIIDNTIGTKYTVSLTSLAEACEISAQSLEPVKIPEGIPFDGEEGQVLYKTDAGVEWKDLDLTNTAYRNIISNTLGDKYLQ